MFLPPTDLTQISPVVFKKIYIRQILIYFGIRAGWKGLVSFFYHLCFHHTVAKAVVHCDLSLQGCRMTHLLTKPSHKKYSIFNDINLFYCYPIIIYIFYSIITSCTNPDTLAYEPPKENTNQDKYSSLPNKGLVATTTLEQWVWASTQNQRAGEGGLILIHM